MGHLLRSFCYLSSRSTDDFRDQNNKAHRHEIDWGTTSEPNGFTHFDEQLQDGEAWQFWLCEYLGDPKANAMPRVHGVLIESVFYVVWIDANHALFPQGLAARESRLAAE